MLLYNFALCRVKPELDLNISIICGEGANAEQTFLESEQCRVKK